MCMYVCVIERTVEFREAVLNQLVVVGDVAHNGGQTADAVLYDLCVVVVRRVEANQHIPCVHQ